MYKYVFYILFLGALFSQDPDSTGDSSLIVPIGEVDKVLLENLANVLQERFNMSFSIGETMKIPADAYDSRRQQYDSSIVLDKLPSYRGKRVLGIIDKDLYVAGLNFVFGQADLPGCYAIVSIPRLRQSFYGLPQDDKIFFERVVKEAVHELGHTYGLRHCSKPECVMFFSNSLMDTDRKSSSFCTGCQDNLKKR